MNESILFILLTIALNVSSKSSSAKIRWQKRSVVHCSKPIPDYQLFEYGYDATEFDVHACPKFAGLKDKLFNLDRCNRRNTHENLNTEQTFDLPDLLAILPIKNSDSTAPVINSIDEYKFDLRTSVDIDEEYLKGLFAANEEYRRVRREFLNGSRAVRVSQSKIYYGLKLKDNDARRVAISEKFKNDVGELPDSFHADPDAYIELIEHFGTHYLFRAYLGARTRKVTIWPADAIAAVANEQELLTNATTNFPDLDDRDRQICLSDNKKIVHYKTDGCNYVHSFHGGDGTEAQSMGAAMWLEKTETAPTIVAVKFRPISQLIDALSNNQRKNFTRIASEVEKAIRAYMARAQLDEAVAALRFLVTKGDAKTSVPKMRIKEYEDLIKDDKYNKLLYDQLLEAINFEIKNIIQDRHKVTADHNKSGGVRHLFKLEILITLITSIVITWCLV